MSEDAHQTADEKTGDAVAQAQPLHHLWSVAALSDRYIITLNLEKLAEHEKFQFLEMWRKVSVEVEVPIQDMHARILIEELHEDRRSEIHRKLDAVRKRPNLGAEYAQLISSPFGPVPSYAEEDPSSEWWASSDAEALLRELTDLLSPNSMAGVKPGGPTRVYPGAMQSWQQTDKDIAR